MSNKDSGGPAFPSHGSMGEVVCDGMTLRDYFAAKAMQAMLSNAHLSRSVMKEKSSERPLANELQQWHADTAYQFADAMLAEREKGGAR